MSKNHSSQGEQRSLALGLRLAGHEIVKKTTGIEPIILLDDVFSELDDTRCQILIELLPKNRQLGHKNIEFLSNDPPFRHQNIEFLANDPPPGHRERSALWVLSLELDGRLG